MYKESRIRQSELFQILILDCLYALSGTAEVFFQGGTALRWVYGGSRFSEDLDFVTPLPIDKIESWFGKLTGRLEKVSIAQFGPGTLTARPKASRSTAFKAFYVYQPRNQRERIAVKVEFEELAGDDRPESRPYILRDLPQITALLASGTLLLPYSSSVMMAETPEEILSDKVRALFERPYLKGRDIYDVWWLTAQMGIRCSWQRVQRKLNLYRTAFKPARAVDFFQKDEAGAVIGEALRKDLPRFIPHQILAVYRQDDFGPFIEAVRCLTGGLVAQGMVFGGGSKK